MPLNKKIKVTKKDLENEEKKKLIEEEELKKQKEKELELEKEKEFHKKKIEWKKKELQKKSEIIEIRKKHEKRRKQIIKRKELEKEKKVKELEQLKKNEFMEIKKDEVELISISSERIKFREEKIQKNIVVLKIINSIEKMLFTIHHQYVYMSVVSKTVRYILNNIKEDCIDIGPLDFLHDFIYSLPHKNFKEKKDYMEEVVIYLLNSDIDTVNKFTPLLNFE